MEKIVFYKKYNYENLPQVMQQYLDIKYNHLDCLLLYRMGDFYELFYEDAIQASEILGIALTQRNKNDKVNKIHMCGVPYHSTKTYIVKLLSNGFKIAICDQLETAEQAKQRGGYKAIVKRGITRIITPGTILEEDMLDNHLPHYLVSVCITKSNASIAYADLSTAEIYVLSINTGDIFHEIKKLNPKELLISEQHKLEEFVAKLRESNIYVNFLPDNIFDYSKSEKIILDFYNVFSLDAIAKFTHLHVIAIGSLLEYISLTQKSSVPKMKTPHIMNSTNYMYIDSFSREKLELTESCNKDKKNTLFFHINNTVTRSGSRLLYQYLSLPLKNPDLINHRLDLVDYFYGNIELISDIREALKNAPDLERAITRIGSNRSNVEDLISIKTTLSLAFKINKLFSDLQEDIINSEFGEDIFIPISTFTNLYLLIDESIDENLASNRKIKISYHLKVENLRQSLLGFQEEISKLQIKYQKMTSIDNIKIANNNILGFFIEITNKNLSKINDPIFIHKQTNVNNARFVTDELKELEYKINNSQSILLNLEEEIYQEICQNILQYELILRNLSLALSKLDVFTALAYLAYQNDYVRPRIVSQNVINIKSGRHPVVEQNLKKQHQDFISNNSFLDHENQILLITGPNMSGKSTFLKQTAIISILAHIGSFVPAEEASIGIIDKIFTRIGAGDNLARGESTFMVEMIETSMILNQATDKSLIILDEIGRGTSTYDGVALAWSILEYIHDSLSARSLFTTHYHELINIPKSLSKVVNYKTDIYESEGKITFLHKIVKGSSDKSYGIHVAELAGLPKEVTQKAYEILRKLSS